MEAVSVSRPVARVSSSTVRSLRWWAATILRLSLLRARLLSLRRPPERRGAVTTPSGLVFEVITEGEGDFPGAADKVNIEYTGRLSDGSVFDKTEEPVSFDLVRLVPGFREGLQMMRPGGEYRIVLPASLGYGERGVGDVIPPGAAIEFTVRLLSVDRSQL